MMETIRTFIAVPLSQNVVDELTNLTRKMRSVSREVKWVRPESIHLTLKFLGHLTPDQLQEVYNGMEEVLSTPVNSFSLKTSRLGAFPHWNRPRVLWVGIGGPGLDALRNLQQHIERALAHRGFDAGERAFSPHLTVGRIKTRKKPHPVIRAFQEYTFPELEFTVNRVEVMRSVLKPGGAEYSVLETYGLAAV